jgi:hypothetical protein
MREAGHLAQIRKKKTAYSILVGNLKGSATWKTKAQVG